MPPRLQRANSQSIDAQQVMQRLSTVEDDVLNSRDHAGGEGAVGQATQQGCDPTGCFEGIFGGASDVADDGEVDVVLVGGGIMSATVGVLLQQLEPTWKIRMYERLSQCGEEASNGWNNAGTGHAALCELNYTPEVKGEINIEKAVAINEKFQVSRQWWAWLVTQGVLSSDTATFINNTPHMTFVHGEKNVDFLRRRFALLKKEPLFSDMVYSEDSRQIKQWAPLLYSGRQGNEPIACTYFQKGTDVDYGALTKQLVTGFVRNGGQVRMNHDIKALEQMPDKSWKVTVYKRDLSAGRLSAVKAKFIFVGAGGASLQILQKSGIPEIRGFGGFPISGEFLVCQNPNIVKQHPAKIYGKAAVGAPPMSVPHLDARIIDGKPMVLFGPYAGFSPRYLKTGSLTDMFSTLRPHNILPMAAAGLQNLDLTLYLIKELMASKEKKLQALKEFIPDARAEDWTIVTAGQRVQVMKADAKKIGILQFGTEVVASADGTIAGLLGASPGASVSTQVGVDVLLGCFPDRVAAWTPKFKQMIPSFGTELSSNPAMAEKIMEANARILKI
ncbi:unnamed protein product [Amoebophrya sp. A120]|nr:unnamed protein product [Amoebophrya sp. A120]|eukprot:GSA120T00019213001.1